MIGRICYSFKGFWLSRLSMKSPTVKQDHRILPFTPFQNPPQFTYAYQPVFIPQSSSLVQVKPHSPSLTSSGHSCCLSSPPPWPFDTVPSPPASVASPARLFPSLPVDAQLLPFCAAPRGKRVRKGLFLAFADVWEEDGREMAWQVAMRVRGVGGGQDGVLGRLEAHLQLQEVL